MTIMYELILRWTSVISFSHFSYATATIQTWPKLKR